MLQRAVDSGEESTAGEARAILVEALVEDGDVRGALALAQRTTGLPMDFGHAAVAALAAQVSIRRGPLGQQRAMRADELRMLIAVARGSLHRELLVAAGLAATGLLRSSDAPDGSRAALYAILGAALAQVDFMGVVHPDEWGRAALEALDATTANAERASVLFIVAQRCLSSATNASECEALLERALTSATMLDQRPWIAACSDALVESAFLRGADEHGMRALIARLWPVLVQRGLVNASRWTAPMRALVHGGGQEALSALPRTARALLLFEQGREHDARATVTGDEGEANESTASAIVRRWLQAMLDARASDEHGLSRASTMASVLATAARMHVWAERCPGRFESMALALDGAIAEALGRASDALDRRERALRAAIAEGNGLLAAVLDHGRAHWTRSLNER